MRRTAIALSATLLVTRPCLSQCDPESVAKLKGSDGDAADICGSAVAIDGNLAAVGAPLADARGAVYLFSKTSGVWKPLVKIVAANGAEDDDFGSSVALSGYRLAVGAPGRNTLKGPDAGAVYIYVPDFLGIWKQQAFLTAYDGANGDHYGMSVALSGETIAVGSPNNDTSAGADAGSAYIYTYYQGAWTLQDTIAAPAGAPNDQFAYTIAISGNTVIAGVPYDDTSAGANAGSAHVFVRKFLGIWTPQAQLFASNGGGGDIFGWSVAISGDSALVGATSGNTPGGADWGAAYVFARNQLDQWQQQAHLYDSKGSVNDEFGWSVALDGPAAVVGAWADQSFTGSVTPFFYDGKAWVRQAKVMSPGAPGFDSFGWAASVSGNQAIVGAPTDTPVPTAFVVDLHCPICYADCDKSGNLDIDDFICFQAFYGTGDEDADCDKSGTIDIDDFICFQTAYGIGCG